MVLEVAKIKLYMERAENEFRSAKTLFNISSRGEIKIKLGANPRDTFYSSVISHSYYAIFYAVKALLLTKNIETKAPAIHRKTFNTFKEKFVETRILNHGLLNIYQDMAIKADELLNIFGREKRKRGQFTYNIIAQANIKPARDSLDNAKKFITTLTQLIERKIKLL